MLLLKEIHFTCLSFPFLAMPASQGFFVRNFLQFFGWKYPFNCLSFHFSFSSFSYFFSLSIHITIADTSTFLCIFSSPFTNTSNANSNSGESSSSFFILRHIIYLWISVWVNINNLFLFLTSYQVTADFSFFFLFHRSWLSGRFQGGKWNLNSGSDESVLDGYYPNILCKKVELLYTQTE